MKLESRILAGGAPNDFLTVRHLRVEGTDREIGRALARHARAVHGPAAGRFPVDPTLQRARRRWFAQHHPVLAERMVGVAEEHGVDPRDDRWDVAWLATYDTPAGCSVVAYPGEGTKDGHTLLGRNFDFPTATLTQMYGLPPLPGERPLAADPWVVELRPTGGYASIVTGIMDVMGGMDGVNEAGLAVALLADNESLHQEPTLGPQVGLSEQQIVRYLLDTCATVDEAKEALLLAKQYYVFVPCHYVVVDRSGRSFVWEHSPGHNQEHIVEPPSDLHGRMICTNHLLHRWPDPALLPDETAEAGTAALSYSRWRSLHTQNASGALVDTDDVREQLRSVRFEAPDVGVRTFWNAVYDLDGASVELSFYLHDLDGRSVFTDPATLSLR